MDAHVCPKFSSLVRTENLEILESGTIRVACLKLAQRRLEESVALVDGYDVDERTESFNRAKSRKLEMCELIAAGSLAKLCFSKGT